MKTIEALQHLQKGGKLKNISDKFYIAKNPNNGIIGYYRKDDDGFEGKMIFNDLDQEYEVYTKELFFKHLNPGDIYYYNNDGLKQPYVKLDAKSVASCETSSGELRVYNQSCPAPITVIRRYDKAKTVSGKIFFRDVGIGDKFRIDIDYTKDRADLHFIKFDDDNVITQQNGGLNIVVFNNPLEVVIMEKAR